MSFARALFQKFLNKTKNLQLLTQSGIFEHSEEAGIDLGIKAQEQSDDKDRSQDDLSLTVYKFLIQPKICFQIEYFFNHRNEVTQAWLPYTLVFA